MISTLVLVPGRNAVGTARLSEIIIIKISKDHNFFVRRAKMTAVRLNRAIIANGRLAGIEFDPSMSLILFKLDWPARR